MALGVITIGAFLGFVVSVVAGLLFGLGLTGILSVYCLTGCVASIVVFGARGLWCRAARMRSQIA